MVLLREPVARAISNYRHQVQRGDESRSPVEAFIDPEANGPSRPNHYKRRGLYADQLERILSVYRRDHLLGLRSEDLFQHPAATYAQVLRFLQLDPSPLPREAMAENVGRITIAIPDVVRDHLRDFYRQPNEKLQQLLPEFPLWSETA